jgi:hypothetical protein
MASPVRVMVATRWQWFGGLLLLGIVGLPSGGCSTCRALAAANRSVEQFQQSHTDARVFFEPGAEALAEDVAANLERAVADVAQAQRGPFVIPVRVFVCATVESFHSYGASLHAGGHTLNHRVFISPKPENTAERVPRLLRHELSHLHLGQRLSLVADASVPPWFSEGLAVRVSGGGGAEGVSEADARRAILEGRTFSPDSGGVFQRRYGVDFGLPEHLFYRQAALFLDFLDGLDRTAFVKLIDLVEHGESLEQAFQASFGTGIQTLWARFRTSLR